MSENRPASAQASASTDDKPEKKRRPVELREPVTVGQSITIDGKPLEYDVTFGALPLTDEYGEPEASIYFTAYTCKPTAGEPRPITFTYNGGPGSSSAWLHLGGLSPKRVNLLDDGELPPPPYRLVDNAETWLAFTDMVFIDPVGTGFSRAATEELEKKFWSVRGDIESVGEIIRLYLTRYGRWTSPVFLTGESYGTFRSAGLAAHLFDHGVSLNGIVLISTVLNMQNSRFGTNNDLPPAGFFPTYTATAWYHRKLEDGLQNRELPDVLKEVEAWVDDVYVPALNKGDTLSEADRSGLVDQIAQYTGLSKAYVDNANLRINIHQFTKELLRDRKQTVGRIDSRFIARDRVHVEDVPEFDPSVVYPGPAYTSVYNDYIRNTLGWKTDVEFEMMSGKVGRTWDWGSAADGRADTSEDLRSAMHRYRYLKVLNMAGYYDFATPYYAAEYTFRHMGIAPEFRKNLEWAFYTAGHMMYIDRENRQKMTRDARDFYERALNPGQQKGVALGR